MKKFFRTVTALTLVCGAFAFTGCTDYEEDINSINNRLDELTTGQIASIEEQVGSLSDAIDEADGLISALQGDVDALETAKTTIEGQIKTLNDNIGTINGNISDINGKISGLETDLEKQIADAKAELEKADQANADRIDKLVSDLDQAKKDLQSEIEKGDKANADAIASLATTVSDNYSALKKAIDDANTSNKAEFDKIYGEIETLKTDLKTQTDALADLTSTVADLSGKVAALETLTAGLPELEKTVADIKENYLSKAEAADIYATAESVLKLQEELGKVSGRLEVIEDLDIAERLSSLESNYENLTDIVIPNLNDAVVKAQSAAEKAQTSAKEAMTYAQSVFGELESLERSLEVYANDIEGRFNELSAMDAALSDRADALMEFVSDLNSTVSAEIIALRSNIASVQTILDQAVKDLESSKLDKAEFGEYFSQALMDDILKANGQVNTAINQKLSEATKNLQSSIDTVNGRIDSEVMPAINNLKERIDAVEDLVQDLANRIQSLVYVPEYNDGKAPVYTYSIGDELVSDRAVATATFKVTPASLADYVVNQYRNNVLVEVVPVKDVSTRVAAAPILVYGDDLKVEKGAAPGYIDVEVSLYVSEVAEDVAFSLYVASADEVNQAEAEGVVDMDAGTYVSSEYVQAAVSEVKLDGSYVLCDAENNIYPDTYEEKVAWSWDAAARKVYFYDGYDICIKLDDEILSLEDAADRFRTTVDRITPKYAETVTYIPLENGDLTADDLKRYFDVKTVEVRPFGVTVDMTKEDEMSDAVGSKVSVANSFYFGKDASDPDKIEVIANVTDYMVVNEPITVSIVAADQRWSYAYALAHADMMDDMPVSPNAKPAEFPAQLYTTVNLGVADLWNEILNSADVKLATSVKVTLNGETVTPETTPEMSFTGIDMTDPENPSIGIQISGYDFSQEGDYVYDFSYVYTLADETPCTVNFSVTFGQMPSDGLIPYGSFEVPFITAGVYYQPLVIGNYTVGHQYAFYKFAQSGNPEYPWFTGGLDEFNSSFINSTVTYRTTKDGKEIDNTYTRLNEVATAEYGDGAHIRVSSTDISAVGNVFAVETVVKTWYGVTYTYTADAAVQAPAYSLVYDNANVTADGYVNLRYEEINGVYKLQEVDPSGYFHVVGSGLADLPENELKVKFEAITVENPAAGIVNVPDLSTVLNVNEKEGTLGAGWNIDWTRYTARQLDMKAILVAGPHEIEVSSLDLHIVVDPIVQSFGVTADPVELTRRAGSTKTIKLWEYLEATTRYDSENIIPTENQQGEPHESLVWVNQNPAMKLYGAEIVLGEISASTDTGNLVGTYKYSKEDGTIEYLGNNAEIANPVTFTVKATIQYYLDYNHKVMDEPQGAYETELTIILSEE